MKNNRSQEFACTAFISCSLRKEDLPFVELVESILIEHKIRPTGTIGRHYVSPTSIPNDMRNNITDADLVVIIATPRYRQKDLQRDRETYGLSEMVHTEIGMAHMSHKPVVAFVQEGVDTGSFLQGITQYVELNGTRIDLENKWPLINSLLENTYQRVLDQKKSKEPSISLGGFLTGALAIFGTFKLLESFGTDEDDY